MNFEPCNPPLMDPLYLTKVTLFTNPPKPIIYQQQDLKILLSPDKKMFPVRPIPLRHTPVKPGAMTSSPPRECRTTNDDSSDKHFMSQNVRETTTNSTILNPKKYSSFSSTEDVEFSASMARSSCSYIYPPSSNFITSQQCYNIKQDAIYPKLKDVVPENHKKSPPVQPLKKSPVQSLKKSPPDQSLKKSPPVQSLKNTSPSSPVQSLKKSPRCSPYSTNSTPSLEKTRKIPLQSLMTTLGSKNVRHEISESQSSILKNWFGRFIYLTSETRKEVSKDTGLPEKTVMYWFQNQRRKVKRSRVVKS